MAEGCGTEGSTNAEQTEAVKGDTSGAQNSLQGVTNSIMWCAADSESRQMMSKLLRFGILEVVTGTSSKLKPLDPNCSSLAEKKKRKPLVGWIWLSSLSLVSRNVQQVVES